VPFIAKFEACDVYDWYLYWCSECAISAAIHIQYSKLIRETHLSVLLHVEIWSLELVPSTCSYL